MAEFLMPSLGADMTAGRLLAWLKGPGERVTRGDIIAEVDTDKGVIQVEVFASGTIERLLVEPGTRVPVGTPLALIRSDGEEPELPVAPGPRRARVSPLARRRAAELGVDAGRMTGTGPAGAVTREDVERAAAAGPPVPAPVIAEPDRVARMRGAIAAAVSRAKREIPHYYIGTSIDLATAMAWLAERNHDRPVAERLAPNVLLLKALAVALRDFPELNGRWVEGRAVADPEVHVGLVISLRQGGLIVATLQDTAERTLDDLGRATFDLVRRARAGELRSSELGGATISATLLGDRGVDIVFGVIYPPQVAIVGFGTIAQRPWVVGDKVEPRPVLTATLAADHRVSDAHRGALYLATIANLLQEPERL